LDAIEIPVNKELQQYGRMIGRSASSVGVYSLEPEMAEITFVYKGFDDSDRVVLRNIIFEHFRKQGTLVSVLAFNKTLHI
jgi:hypothetical protein